MAESLVELQNMFALHAVEKRTIFAFPQDSNHDSSVVQPMGVQIFSKLWRATLKFRALKKLMTN